MSRATCTVDGCDSAINARGLCHLHYKRWWKHGDPLVIGAKGMPPRRRFPLEPLLTAFAAAVGEPVSDYRIAQMCEIDHVRLIEWRKAGGVTWPVGDRICCRVLGLHPLLIWPDFYDDVDTSEVAA